MTRDHCLRALEILAELERLPAMKVLALSGSIDVLLAESPNDPDLQDIAGMLSDFVLRKSLGQHAQADDVTVEMKVLISVWLCRPQQ